MTQAQSSGQGFRANWLEIRVLRALLLFWVVLLYLLFCMYRCCWFPCKLILVSNTSPKKASRQEDEETNMQFYAALTHYTTVLRDAVCYNHSRAFFERRNSCADVLMWPWHLFMDQPTEFHKLCMLIDAQYKPTCSCGSLYLILKSCILL